MMNEPTKRPDEAVPLVIYKGGERIVIGSAILKGDGRIEAQIAKDVREDLKDLLFGGRVGDFSINPKLPPNIESSLSDANLLALRELLPERPGS